MIKNHNGEYTIKRGLIESLPGGSYAFISQGKIVMQAIQTPAGQQQRINDDRIFEGWKCEFDSTNTEGNDESNDTTTAI